MVEPRQDEFVKQLVEMRALAASRIVTSQVDGEIIIRLVRLLETLAEGKPTTPLPLRHNP